MCAANMGSAIEQIRAYDSVRSFSKIAAKKTRATFGETGRDLEPLRGPIVQIFLFLMVWTRQRSVIPIKPNIVPLWESSCRTHRSLWTDAMCEIVTEFSFGQVQRLVLASPASSLELASQPLIVETVPIYLKHRMRLPCACDHIARWLLLAV